MFFNRKGRLCRRHFTCALWVSALAFWMFVSAGTLKSEGLSPAEGAEVVLEPKFVHALARASDFRIAVLPVQNHTVDPDAAHYLRTELAARSQAKGFTLMSLEMVDESLNRLGISHAGQLQLLPFDQLRSALRADGVLSAVIEQAAVQHAGVFNSYVFTASVKLQNARDGEVVWAVLTERVAKRRFALDPLNAAVDVLLVRRGADTQAAMAFLAEQVLNTLPDGPRAVTFGDPLLDRAIEIVVEPTDEPSR